jgi:hypothetical protein
MSKSVYNMVYSVQRTAVELVTGEWALVTHES